MIRIAVPALTVVLLVAAFVGAAGWNQSGEPRLTITLTERELPLPWSAASDDDLGFDLRLEVQHRDDPLDARNWLPNGRLREIGFDLDVAAGAPNAVRAYDNVPSRLAWVALEYDGPAWRSIERQRSLRDPGERRHDSRLVPVDAGADFDRLRQRYPSRHLIMRAVIGLTYVPPEAGGPLVHGRLVRVMPARVAVPPALRPAFDGLTRRDAQAADGPRYEAELAIGRLSLPFVRTVRLTP